ncbi:deferrochelatase/peroxidase EfeB (plasmid) [Paroceanicella profunda]|uniref:Deferrochelatase n=1 Tax=Paroceanicella profunda TaxID=2579971 RepID=A0A5B8FJ17_9RHOB|nr:iron uptake transporter deferrochelatase/peroxidase subunit [Paroceanicella profunda]QDL94401.1 deferrochelatase/peroxidase EfeB [Paroceanicella profunda]
MTGKDAPSAPEVSEARARASGGSGGDGGGLRAEASRGPRLGRRHVLVGLAGGGLALGCPMGAGAAQAPQSNPATDAPDGTGRGASRQPFHGLHQSGIVTPRPASGLMVAFDVVATSPADLETLLRRLTERIAFLTTGGPVETRDPRLPPVDSGLLGPVVAPDDLTVTVSLGASLFENRPWLGGLAPRRLTRMEAFPNDALEAGLCHGDLALQFCANLQDTNIHALRDILKSMPEFLVPRWMQEGSVPVVAHAPGAPKESARNFLGFRDGSANPDAGDEALMDRVVWVGEGAGEPGWATGGSYQAVRIIRNFVERWDRTPLREQQRIFGRQKDSGAPLDGRTEADLPDYAADPEGAVTPLASHIRRANPRTAEAARHLILRRPFNYSNGVTRSGQLDQGLLFIAYQADLEAGFISVQRALDGEPLEEYIKPVGGGYFYVLPGVRDSGDWLGRSLIDAVKQSQAQPSPTPGSHTQEG